MVRVFVLETFDELQDKEVVEVFVLGCKVLNSSSKYLSFLSL
jgi:hypothetical protein